MGAKRGTVRERFERYLMPTGTCVIWTGTTDGYYGLLGVDGQMAKAHRVAWELAFGPIPPGSQVLHRCDVTTCVRPSHLFLGDPDANAKDREAKGRGNPAGTWATRRERYGMAGHR